MCLVTLKADPGDQFDMTDDEYAVISLYVRMGMVLFGNNEVVESKPFLSQAVHIVGVFERVSALDPLRPLILAVTPLILIWSYIPAYAVNIFDERSCFHMLMAIALDV